MDVFFVDQPFDDGRARGRRAQAFFLHCLAQFVVVDEFARSLHCREQRRLGVARRRLGLERIDGHVFGADFFVSCDGDQVRIVFLRFLAVHGEPTRRDHDFAVGLELVLLRTHLDAADARRHHELGRWKEYRQKAFQHHVVELRLDLAQTLGRLQRRDDGEVVRDLRVVEDAFVRLDVTLFQRRLRVHRQGAQRPWHVLRGDHLHRLLHDVDIVFRQGLAVGSRIGEHLVFFVQRLRDRQRRLGREAEARIGLALQRRQVVQARRTLRAGLGFLAHARALTAHRVGDRLGVFRIPQAIRALLRVVGVLLPFRIEPFAVVLSGLRRERCLDLPVGACHVFADFFFALDHDRQRRSLYTSDGGEKKPAIARIERRHRTRAVDAHQPVGLGAAACGFGQAQQLLVAAQVREALDDRRGRHALQPESLHRGFALAVLLDQAKDQFALAPRVAGVDQRAHILALDELDDGVEPPLALVDRIQFEVRRNHRQVREAPLAALHLEGFGRLDLQQMLHRRRDDVALALEVFVMLVELAHARRERPHDVLGNRGLLGNDQGFGHVGISLQCRSIQSVPRARLRTHARTHEFNVPKIFR